MESKCYHYFIKGCILTGHPSMEVEDGMKGGGGGKKRQHGNLGAEIEPDMAM
ncbi:hypothetical protein HanRHA438_Chr01g0006521 [Helianthus annuus]|nr:hypothetical protein HanRHA438_Chr01g0006521 [Helianthus annuus]